MVDSLILKLFPLRKHSLPTMADSLMTHVASDYLHTKSGSFPITTIKSFEIKDNKTILHFKDSSLYESHASHVCNEEFPSSVIQNLRNHLNLLSIKQPSTSSDERFLSKLKPRNAFEIFGAKNDLESFAEQLHLLDINQPMFVQYFDNDCSRLFVLIDHPKETLDALAKNVQVKTSEKTTIYQTEISSFASFRFNTLENKSSVVQPLLLDNMNDVKLIQFTEELFEKFCAKNLFVQMTSGDWGEAYMYLVFLGVRELSVDQRKTLFDMCQLNRATLYPSAKLGDINYLDDRTMADVRPFVYNTMPLTKKSDIPVLPEFTSEDITITISDQFTKMNVWESIGKEIKALFPDVIMYLSSGPLQSLKLFVTIKQTPGVDIFTFEKILTDLGLNVKQFNISVDPKPSRNPKEVVKFAYNTFIH